MKNKYGRWGSFNTIQPIPISYVFIKSIILGISRLWLQLNVCSGGNGELKVINLSMWWVFSVHRQQQAINLWHLTWIEESIGGNIAVKCRFSPTRFVASVLNHVGWYQIDVNVFWVCLHKALIGWTLLGPSCLTRQGVSWNSGIRWPHGWHWLKKWLSCINESHKALC